MARKTRNFSCGLYISGYATPSHSRHHEAKLGRIWLRRSDSVRIYEIGRCSEAVVGCPCGDGTPIGYRRLMPIQPMSRACHVRRTDTLPENEGRGEVSELIQKLKVLGVRTFFITTILILCSVHCRCLYLVPPYLSALLPYVPVGDESRPA